jgi:hypothetical protein
MRISRLFFLLFRYVTLAFVGVFIAFLWKICHLEHYEHWGKFYALWVPLLYGFFSTGYVVVAECFSRGVTCHDGGNGFRKTFDRFRNYDDYTYLLPVWIFVLEVSGPYLKNVYLWLSISYLAFLVLKASLFLAFLYQIICNNQLDATSTNHQSPIINHQSSIFPIRIQCILVLSTFVVYSLISAYHIKRTSITGDEPHYLLITHSVWHDHDTNLYNNYQNRDYTSFFWYDLQPAWGDQVSDTEIYSYRHKGGFPHTLIPGYVLGGQSGVILQINLITALLMLQVFLLSYELFHSLTASFFTWVCMSFTIPVIIYMGQIYPETLAALLVLWSVRRIRILFSGDSLPGRHFLINCLHIGISLIALMFLVFLKTRYIPLAGILLLFLYVQLFQGHLSTKQKIRVAVGLTILLLVGALAIWLVDIFFFDKMLLKRLTDRFADSEWMEWILKGYNPLFGFLGLLFDQEYGVFPYTPFYILALVGAGMLTWKELKATWPILGVVFLNYTVICRWPLWHAAPTPPSRYILPVLPLLGVFLARFLVQKNGSAKMIVLGVSAIWSFLFAWIVTLSPQWRYNWADGANNFFEMLSFRLSVDITEIFPSWIRLSPLTPYLTVLGIVGIAALIYYGRVNVKKSSDESRQRSLEFQIISITAAFLVCSTVGLAIAKKLPTLVLEAEDTLDMGAHGGEREPSSLDPWNNQDYLRTQKYYGWKLFPGNFLKARPKLSPGEIEIEVSARAESDEQEQSAFPVMLVFINEKEIGRATVSSTGWKVYTFPVFIQERRPLLEIKHDPTVESKRALIIDKVRF